MVLGMTGLSPASAEPSGTVARLGVGDSAFWSEKSPASNEAPLIELPNLDDAPPEPCQQGKCVEYVLDLVERGARLRIGVDTPECGSSMKVQLVDPTGKERDSTETCYSVEMFVRDPSKGKWTIRAWPGGDAAPYRMRARLEGPPAAPGAKRKLLPNLRVDPPSEFTFSTRGIAGLTSPSPESCYKEEVLEDSARKCLRFTVGPQNVGTGPLELKFDRLQGTDAAMRQRVYFSDGTSKMRDAGQSEFHKTHQHFHLKGFARFDLHRVMDREKGTLQAVGKGNKAGFCLVDYKIGQWRRFNQEPAYSARSDCMPVGGQAELGLSAGWTDLYGYDLPGNYVEFGNNGDGHYVLKVTVDSLGYILESNERDNRGYTYIRIKGGEITILERGHGTGPWDPKKVMIRDWWRR